MGGGARRDFNNTVLGPSRHRPITVPIILSVTFAATASLTLSRYFLKFLYAMSDSTDRVVTSARWMLPKIARFITFKVSTCVCQITAGDGIAVVL